MTKKVKKIRNDLFELDGKRIERGPRLMKATATKALLENSVTADHYQVGLRDAMGTPIALGEQMNYFDWKNPDNFTWHTYRWSAIDDHPEGGFWEATGNIENIDEARQWMETE